MDDDYQHHHEPAVVEEEVKDRGLLDFVGKEEEEKVVEELEKVKIEEGACEEGKKPSLLKKLHRSGSSSSSIPQIHEGDIELGICQDVNSISEVHDSAYDTLNGDNGANVSEKEEAYPALAKNSETPQPAPVDIEALRVGADSGRLAMAAGLIAADWSAGIPLTGTDTLMMAKFLHRLFILVSLLAYAFAISLLLKDNVHLHSRSRSKQNLCVQPGAICLATLAVLLMAMTCLLRI